MNGVKEDYDYFMWWSLEIESVIFSVVECPVLQTVICLPEERDATPMSGKIY